MTDEYNEEVAAGVHAQGYRDGKFGLSRAGDTDPLTGSRSRLYDEVYGEGYADGRAEREKFEELVAEGDLIEELKAARKVPRSTK